MPPPVRSARPSAAPLTRLVALVVVSLLALTACTAGADERAGTPDETSPAPRSSTADASPEGSGTEAPSTGGRGGAARAVQYVALGDSYTAAPLVPETDTGGGCLQSSGNYPHLVASELRFALIDVSCVGATSASMVGVQQVPGGQTRPPQFEALGPGTDLVTIGIGGNDVDLFTTLAGRCFPLAREDPTGSPCTDELRGGPEDLRPRIAELDERMQAIVAGVRDRAPKAQIIVVTYPQLLPARGTCEEAPLAAGDYAYVRRVNTALSRTLLRGARAAEADIVDMLRRSEGHDVCSDEPWINGARTDAARALAFHPFDVEQGAVANAIIDLVDSPDGPGRGRG